MADDFSSSCCPSVVGDISTTYTAQATVSAAATTAQASIRGAEIQLDGIKFDATARKEAAVETATIGAGAETAVAQIQASAAVAQANIDALARTDVAQTQADATRDSSTIQADASRDTTSTQAQAAIQTATLDATARTAVAATQAQATVDAAQIDADARTSVASTQANATVSSAQTEAQSRTAAADAQASAVRYEADRQLEGVEFSQLAETSRLNSRLAFAESKIQQFLPLLLGVTDGDGDDDDDALAALLPFAAAPYLSARPVFTPAEVQQQVNQIYARNDARTVSSIRQAQGDLAGRGFSSNSPLIEAIRIGLQGQNLQASVAGAAQVRLGSAQANLDALYHGQELRNTQYNQLQNVVLDSQKNVISRQVGLLGAVAQMIAGVA